MLSEPSPQRKPGMSSTGWSAASDCLPLPFCDAPAPTSGSAGRGGLTTTCAGRVLRPARRRSRVESAAARRRMRMRRDGMAYRTAPHGRRYTGRRRVGAVPAERRGGASRRALHAVPASRQGGTRRPGSAHRRKRSTTGARRPAQRMTTTDERVPGTRSRAVRTWTIGPGDALQSCVRRLMLPHRACCIPPRSVRRDERAAPPGLEDR
jgi:hypothetical protein